MENANNTGVTINPWIIALTVMLATFMEVLDTSVANVALPHIAGSLSASVDEATWVLTSYLVSNAIVLPLSGWFSSLIGRKRFYMTCVALFTVSSMLCGLAPSLTILILCRIMQGIGGGALQPISQAILVESFPRHKQGMAMAVYGMGVVVAPVIGPTLGGWITDNYSWRWIFLINIPVGALSLTLTSLLIYDPPYLVRRAWKGMRVDYMGLGLLSLGLASLEIMLDDGQKNDWFGSNFIVTHGRDRDHRAGRGGGLGTAAEGAGGGFPHAAEPQFHALHRHHVYPGLRAVRQHHAAARVPANAAGLYGHAQRPGAFAGRIW